MAYVGSTLTRLSQNNRHFLRQAQKQIQTTRSKFLKSQNGHGVFLLKRNIHMSRSLRDEAEPTAESGEPAADLPKKAKDQLQKRAEAIKAAKDIDDLHGLNLSQLTKSERKKVEKLEMDDIYREIKEEWMEELMDEAPQDPILHDSVREEMYSLHISDPVKYSINELAIKHQCRPERVAGILLLMQHRRDVEISRKTALDPTVHNLVELNFIEHFSPIMGEDVHDLVEEETMKKLKSLGSAITEGGVNDAALLESALNQNLDEFILGKKKFKLSELPFDKPQTYPEPIVLSPPTRTEEQLNELRRTTKHEYKNFYVVNSDPDRNDKNREIIVFQPDGMIRTATWKERYDLLTPEHKTDMNDLVERSLGPHYHNRPENKERVAEELKILESIAQQNQELEKKWREQMKSVYQLTDEDFKRADEEAERPDEDFDEYDEDEDFYDEDEEIEQNEEIEREKEDESRKNITRQKARATAKAREAINTRQNPPGSKLHSEAETDDAKHL